MGQPTPRRLSSVVRGRLHLLARAFLGQPLTMGQLVSHARPTTLDAPQKHGPPAERHNTRTPREKEHRRHQKQPAALRPHALS